MEFSNAKEDTLENIEAMQLEMDACLSLGMVDEGGRFNDKIALVSSQVVHSHTWEELQAAIEMAQDLETELEAWLAIHGRSTLGFEWPSPQ
jgi:hypothetical protein